MSAREIIDNIKTTKLKEERRKIFDQYYCACKSGGTAHIYAAETALAMLKERDRLIEKGKL